MRWTGLLAVCGTTKAGLEPMAVADKAKADVVRRPGLCRVTGDLSATLAGRELALPHHHSHTTFQQKLLMKSSLIGFFTSHWPPKFSWVDAKLIRVPLKLRSTANRQKKHVSMQCQVDPLNFPSSIIHVFRKMTSNCGETHVFSEDG